MREELSSGFKKPSLSVFVTNYNHDRYVGRAIEAIARQSRRPDELVVVDDGSTDNSREVLRRCQKKYGWIKLISFSRNAGAQFVQQKMIPRLKGDYIYFGSSDDYVRPGFFEKSMRWAEKYPRAGMIFGDIRAVTPAGEELYSISVHRWQQPLYASPEAYRRQCLEAEVASRSFVGSTIFKASALAAVGGFRPELGSWADSFAARAIGLRFGACYIPDCFMTWVKSPGSWSHSTSRRPRKMLAIVKRAACLMRSDEFKQYFPAGHVKNWQRGYRAIIFEQFLLSCLGDRFVMRLARSDQLRSWRRGLWTKLYFSS